jgi:hypothetical protein
MADLQILSVGVHEGRLDDWGIFILMFLNKQMKNTAYVYKL